VNEVTLFDGYSCINNRTRLQMVSTTSYANTVVDFKNSDNSYTLEFWVRPKSFKTGTIAYLTLVEYGNQNTVYL
jgi:hypothetical protein